MALGDKKITATTISEMPRGGPNASWLDRRLQTDALEYTDRYDVPDHLKRCVVSALDRAGDWLRLHEKIAQLAIDVVTDVEHPRILEVGAGHGRLSEHILRLHPTATVTVTDLDPTSVDNIAAGRLAEHPRAVTKVVDAAAINDPDDTYDLVVFSMSFHHLPPGVAYRAVAEGTRVGQKFLVVDIKRPRSIALLLAPVVSVLPIPLIIRPFAAARATMHDAFISGLRSYSPAAFTALGRAAGPDIHTEFLSTPVLFPPPIAILYTRRRPCAHI
jgi:SAM-dependent methyltransferase